MGVEAPSPAPSEAPSKDHGTRGDLAGTLAGALAPRHHLPRVSSRESVLAESSIGDGAPRGDASRGVSGG